MVKYITKSGRNLYSGKITIRSYKYRLGDKIIEKEIVEHQNSVGIIAIDAEEKIILVKQFRVAARSNLLEIPAGKIEHGENPHVAALREMNEEIGYTGKLTPIFQCYLAPGYDTEKMHFFLATDIKLSKKRLPQDEDEDIKIRKMKLSTALDKCLTGQIMDCKTIAAIMTILKFKNIKSKRSHIKKSLMKSL